MAKRALFILNPAARRAPPAERVRAALDGLAGWETALALTEAAAHATELAREAARAGQDAVIACGGDGTVNEVANGLAGSQTALAVVRGGTANVWAKEARLPRKLSAAVGLLNDGEVRAIDLGKAGDRYFVALAGVGFDAAVVLAVHSGLKQRLGAASYILHGLRLAFSYRSTPAELALDGDPLASELYWLLLGNTRNYGGVLNITDRALVNDGLLDFCLLRRGGMLRLAWMAIGTVLHRHHSRVGYRTLTSLDVRTPGLPVEIDGEYLGETPLRFEVAPGALRVIVPRGLTSPLFGPG